MLYWFFPTMYWGLMKKAYVMQYNIPLSMQLGYFVTAVFMHANRNGAIKIPRKGNACAGQFVQMLSLMVYLLQTASKMR